MERRVAVTKENRRRNNSGIFSAVMLHEISYYNDHFYQTRLHIIFPGLGLSFYVHTSIRQAAGR